MAFKSILFDRPYSEIAVDKTEQPAFFRDLNLDQVVSRITAGWESYNLAPFFYTQIKDTDAVAYRQEIMRDFGNASLLEGVKSFSEKMREIRRSLDRAKHFQSFKYAAERQFLEAVEVYCEAIEGLHQDLCALELGSRGLRGLREYLASYVTSATFRDLTSEAGKIKSSLSEIRYLLLIKEGNITVRKYEGETDYSVAVEETFEKFRREVENNCSAKVPPWDGMNHIESQIQDQVALLYPDIFRGLGTFCKSHQEYLDKTISVFDREVQFYVAYRAFVKKFREAGLAFCEPRVSSASTEVQGRGCFDLALASKLVDERRKVISNDFYLHGSERILVVSGPNQGGKTTFARMFGQLHYLASLGCPVPGEEVRVFLFDRLFTHFEREENAATLRGKLQDDLMRMRQILEAATPNSLVVMNEIFSSTTLSDALFLSKKIMEKLSALDLIGVWVTFLDELSSLNDKTVSMVSMVDPENPAIRTYKLERRAADGLAYALAVAEKYHVTYDWLLRRIKT